MRFSRTPLTVTAVGILALIASCRDIVAPPPVATVSLSAYSADLVPSETELITATPRDASGAALERPLVWKSSAPTVATVENGLITGRSWGNAVISAESEGIKAEVAVIVGDGGIVTPAGTLVYGLGGRVEIDFPSASVSQSAKIIISQPTLASSSIRLVPGSAVSILTQVTINQPALLIIKYDSNNILGSPEAGLSLYEATPTAWRPINGNSVDVTTKTVRGQISRSGVYGIFAQAKVASVSVSPTTPALKVGESAPFSALIKDEDGTKLDGRAIAWTSSAPAVLQVDAGSGVAQAKAPGSATVSATSEGMSGSTTVSVTTGPPASLVIVAGNQQSADTSTAVAIAPSVKVTDQAGFAIVGATVTFAVTGGGGSISPGSVATDASGIATATRWTLGNVAGVNSLTATISGGASVGFSATATQPAPPPVAPPAPLPAPPPAPPPAPAPMLVPTTIASFAGDGQRAVVGSAVSIRPAARVTTAAGVGVPGVTVTFSIRSGGGSVTGAVSTTDSTGVATVGSWILGGETIPVGGGNSLFATATGLTGSPLVFVATATSTPTSAQPPPSSPPSPPAPSGPTAGPPVAMAIFTGDRQTGAALSPVAVAPAVKVTDAAGVGVPGIAVTFSIRSGGGSVTGEVATTNSSGIATLGEWLLGQPGGQSLFATRAGLSGSPLVFVATATGGIQIVTFGDSNTDAGWYGTDPNLASVSYVSSSAFRLSPSAPNHSTQLAGKIESLWRTATGGTVVAVNHGVSGTRSGTGRTSLNAPNARESVNGVTRFDAEVLGAGNPWSGGESGSSYPNGPLVRVKAFIPSTKDFAYVSIGTNDFVDALSADQTAANIGWMIDRWVATGHPADHFIVTTLAPRNDAGGAIPPINTRVRSLAATRGVGLIDIAQRTSDDNGATWKNSSLDNVGGDGIHFSEGVRDWIAAQVVAYLRTKTPN